MKKILLLFSIMLIVGLTGETIMAFVGDSPWIIDK